MEECAVSEEDGIKWSFDTIPHILTVIVGMIITFLFSTGTGIIYTLIVIGGMFWFWAFICTRCRACGNQACPSGYGIISKRLFKKRKGDFARAFKLNIISVALQWFIPLGVGIYDILTNFDPIRLVLLAVFILVAFVYLPLAARSKGCDSCPQKKDCPWKK